MAKAPSLHPGGDTLMPTPVLFEVFGGQSVDCLLTGPMAPERFLDLAVRIAGAVADLHRQGIVHRDLKPENILVHPATLEVKLAGLGLASRLPREQRAARAPELVEGSLPYMSPEQTGRVHRALDSRSDLYSLGVTFYQVLTCRLPFEARDPPGWIHCHVARAPTPLSQHAPEVPEAVECVIMKLLAKMADDRYQTAHGLQHDLRRCLDQWRSQGRIDPFPLGERDRSDQPQIPQKLYGREEQVAALLRAFERVRDAGAPELVLVSGYSGIGKSSLVHEMQRGSVREQNLFASGKFDERARDAPCSAIVQAFREVVLDVLAEGEEQVAEWRRRVQAALGVNAQLIVDVMPQIELLIGKQTAIPELPPMEARNRFGMVLRNFIGVFAREERPLALFLDDLQWADPASLALLQDVATHPDVRHVLVIGAYRDNEVTPGHALQLALDAARGAGARVSDIVLGPLSPEHLSSLVGDALRCPLQEAAPLAALVLEKTAANPFFAIQFLTELHDERLIELDGHAGVWRWDADRIRAKGFTDNVVDLMVRKLRRLPAATQDALRRFACLGSSAEVGLLTLVLDCPEANVGAVLWDALGEGLILRAGRDYKFLHDRVHEAAYSLVPQESRPAEHLRIGRLLRSRLPREALEERVFDVVGQLNRGVDLITDADEKRALRQLDTLAARKAKAAIAYASARSLLAQATELLPPDPWGGCYEETFALFLALSECEYLVGAFQSADELFDLLLANGRSVLDRASVYRLRMRLYQVAGRFDDAVTAAFDGLRLLGVVVPESDVEIQAATEAERREVEQNLRGRRIGDLAEAPAATDADVRAIVSLIAEALSPIYNARPDCYPLLTVKAVNLSLRHGNTEESCFAYSCYASLLVSLFGDAPAAFEFSEMSLRLNERFGDAKLKGALLFLHGTLVHFWRRPFATGARILEQAFAACLDVGDLVFAGFNAFEATWQAVERGDPLDEVLTLSRRYIAFAAQSHNEMVHQVVRFEEQFVACLQGRTLGPGRFDDGSFDEAECLGTLSSRGFGVGAAMYHIMKLFAAYTYGRYDEALEHSLRAESVLRKVMAMAFEATYTFYRALTLAALHPLAPPARRLELVGAIWKELQKLERWAGDCPANFLDRRALVAAEFARVEGRELDAERLYEQAIGAARASGFVQNEALAHELASRFHRARGFELIADAYLGAARACYARWGADGKVKQLERLHPQIPERRPLAATATLAVRSEQLDLLSVVKASQTISGEIVLERLLGTLLEAVLEQGCAQRACLMLARGDELSMEAEAVAGESGVKTRLLPSSPVMGGPATPDTSPTVPLSLIHYARRTREPVILDDAAAHPGKFASDTYVVRHGPRSVLCLPILRQAELVGLLYLENNHVAGAFTPNRLTALTLLASQAAISVQNALLLSHERVSREAAERVERDAQRAIHALRESEERLRLAQDAAKAGTWEWDLRTDENFWSEGLWELYGLEPHSREPSYEAWRQTIHPDDRANAEEVVQLAARAGTELNLEWRVRSRSGPERWLMARGRPVRDAAGRVVRYIGISVDITDRKRAEEALREEDRRKGHFLGVLSHELRNPLAPIRSSIYVLDRAPPSSVEAARAKEIIRRQTSHLSRLVDDLLDVTRIARGKVELRRERLDARDPVRQASEDHRGLFEQSQIRLSVVLPSCPVWIDADATRISQALGNLLQNAVKFTPPPGVVTVAVEVDGPAAVVRVTDSGLGMEQRLIEQIFEPFVQAKQDLARTRGGLGLGLALAKGLAELHGGTVSARSEGLGFGSEFAIRLPLAPQPPARAGGLAAQVRPVVRSVLIIEDNADAGRSLADAMELNGHRARVARDGRSGIAFAREMKPDVIVCDIGLPDIDGYEIARMLRTEEAFRSTRLIALSGYAQPEDRQRSKEAGFDVHLGKPPPLDELQELLVGAVASEGRA